jgi:TRAP-type C4-dicarboxylate transport system permease small subunit
MFMNKTKLFLDRFIFMLTCLSALASFFCMFFISVCVGSRYILGYSVPGMLETTELMLVLIIFFPLAYVERNRGHLQISILFDTFPRRAKSILQFIWRIITCILLGFIAVMSFRGMIISFSEREASWGDFPIPLWIPKLFIFVGCLAMVIYDLIYIIWPRDDIGAKG